MNTINPKLKVNSITNQTRNQSLIINLSTKNLPIIEDSPKSNNYFRFNEQYYKAEAGFDIEYISQRFDILINQLFRSGSTIAINQLGDMKLTDPNRNVRRENQIRSNIKEALEDVNYWHEKKDEVIETIDGRISDTIKPKLENKYQIQRKKITDLAYNSNESSYKTAVKNCIEEYDERFKETIQALFEKLYFDPVLFTSPINDDNEEESEDDNADIEDDNYYTSECFSEMEQEERKETYNLNCARGSLLSIGYQKRVLKDHDWFWRLPNLIINRIKDIRFINF